MVMTISKLGEAKRKELDKLIMLGKMSDSDIAVKLWIDRSLVVSRRRSLRSRKNFDKECAKLRKKLELEETLQTLQEQVNATNVVTQVAEETKDNPAAVIAANKRRRRTKVTKELELELVAEYEKCHNCAKVARKYNCSEGLVRRVAVDFGVFKAKVIKDADYTVSNDGTTSIDAQQASEKPVVVVESEEKAQFTELDLGKHVVCSMFADRHNVPKDCKESIFDTNGLESNLVLDFAWIDSKIQTFILNHINFDANGKPDKDLVVYVSGLQSTLGSICKFCAAMGIKLTLMHYDPAYGKYFPQVVIEGSTNTATYNSKLGKLLEFDHVFLYKDMDVEFLGSTSFYAAVKTIYKDVEQHKQESWCYICPAVLSGFDAFRDLTIDIRNHPEAYGSVYLYQVNNRSNGLYFSGSIAKSYNFKKG